MTDRVIETERLKLRPFCTDDLDIIEKLYCDEEILRYTPFDVMSHEQAAAHLRRIVRDWEQVPLQSLEFAVLLKATGEKIGRCHILVDPETDTGMVGGFLLKKHWGQRLGEEFFGAMIRYSFDGLHLHRVNAVCNPKNVASWKALEHFGMRREALFRQKCRYIKHGAVSWEDELEYALLASEMNNNK